MSADVPSDEVALDFQDSLQDLQGNNRYEIQNLTIIAKENTEHAQAISMVLEKHIKKTAPRCKLPALYVLDSIAKNVGTPYTVYLGRNLFSTFMEAYTLVDSAVRKQMEGMLKTWKEPVPGSVDPRPVFPLDVTRNIENALIKARTAAVQQQQQTSRNRGTPVGFPSRPGSMATFRNTPTPPQNGYHIPPPQNAYQNAYRTQQPTPQQQAPGPTPQVTPELLRLLSGSIDPQKQELDTLKTDIQDLIGSFQNEFARNPYEPTVQTKLKALLDLQSIVKGQQLGAESIGLIKTQVAGLKATLPKPVAVGVPSAAPSLAMPQWQPPTPVPQAFQPPPQMPGYAPPPSVQPAPAAPAMPNFAPGVLEQLLASTANGQKPATPTLPNAIPALQSMPPAMQSPRTVAATPATTAPPTGNPLIDALRASGLLQSTPTPSAAPLPAPPIPNQSTASILQSLAPALSKIANTPQLPHRPTALSGPGKPRIPLTNPNLKLFRPELIHTLYDAQPNQCTTCGRRFPASDAGRAKKARHLDWHFRTNQRLADALHTGQNRSWYIDELEWISLREFDVSAASADDEDAANASAAAAAASARGQGANAGVKSVKENYIAAPTGAAAAANATCPICQEKFETVWHDDAQEWVWMNAVKRGGRVYHADCHEEVSKAAAATRAVPAGFTTGASNGERGRSATPDIAASGTGSVLGKRKADADLASLLKAKLKKDGGESNSAT